MNINPTKWVCKSANTCFLSSEFLQRRLTAL